MVFWARVRILKVKMSTPGQSPRGSLGLRLKVVLALYVLAAALLPFGHHDLACHIKSTTHCATCVVGSSAEAAADPAVLARFWLLDAGKTLLESVDLAQSAVTLPESGRAPPSIA